MLYKLIAENVKAIDKLTGSKTFTFSLQLGTNFSRCRICGWKGRDMV